MITASLFAGAPDETAEDRYARVRESLVIAYAAKLVDERTVYSTNPANVGLDAARRNALTFARKDVRRLLDAIEQAGFVVTDKEARQ